MEIAKMQEELQKKCQQYRQELSTRLQTQQSSGWCQGARLAGREDAAMRVLLSTPDNWSQGKVYVSARLHPRVLAPRFPLRFGLLNRVASFPRTWTRCQSAREPKYIGSGHGVCYEYEKQ